MFGLSISQNSKTITQNSSPCHISKLYLSKKSKTEKSCLVYNPNPCISTFSLFGGAHSLHFQNGHMFLARVTFSLLSSKICLPRHTHTHTHTHTPNVRTESISSTLPPPYPQDPSPTKPLKKFLKAHSSLIAQFLPVSSVPFLLYGLCCYDFLLFLCPELTPKSKNWSTPISSKSHFPFHLAQSSVVVPEVCTYEGFRSSALMFMFMFILSWD